LRRNGVSRWPEEVLAFSGIEDAPSLEAIRSELRPPADDPLA